MILMQIRNNYPAYLLFIFVAICSLLIPFFQAFAGSGSQDIPNPVLILRPDKQFNYAQDLFSAKDYLTAVIEYKRFIYFFPEDKRVELAMFQVGQG